MGDIEFRKHNLEKAIKATNDHFEQVHDTRVNSWGTGMPEPKSYDKMLKEDVKYIKQAQRALNEVKNEQENP